METSRYVNWQSTGSPWAIACGVHVVALVLCSLISFHHSSSAARVAVDSAWSANEAPEELELEIEISEMFEPKPETRDQASAALQTTSQTASASEVSVAPPQPTELFAVNPLAVSTAEYQETFRVSTRSKLGEMFLEGDGEETGGEGEGGGGFFSDNTKDYDRRIVYVVDASASMNHPHESRAKTRFGRVKFELVKSIESLLPHQEFCIYFFNSFSTPMSPGYCVARGRKTPQKLYDWIAKFQAKGQTEPLDSLKAAVAQRPDLIYFLTDGQISKRDLERASQLNHDQARFSTICIGDNSSETQLKSLSAGTGGTYTFVP